MKPIVKHKQIHSINNGEADNKRSVDDVSVMIMQLLQSDWCYAPTFLQRTIQCAKIPLTLFLGAGGARLSLVLPDFSCQKVVGALGARQGKGCGHARSY